MRYRKLDANGDYSFGRSTGDMWVDVPDAPAQAVVTRLALWTGQWFLDVDEGTPWQTQVLGKRTASSRDPVIRFRTLGTPGVLRIDDYSSNLDRDLRAFSANMVISTVYGPVEVVSTL